MAWWKNFSFLCYFAHEPGARWAHGEAYVAVSKLPWLTALHAFGTCGTWTRGYHFTEGQGGEHPEGAERRRGWVESPDSPPRAPGDTWDERRNALFEEDLSLLEPDPAPAPDWARRW